MSAVIRSTGLWTPDESVSNDELVACFNAYVERFNAENADAIARGSVEAKNPSSSGFIEKASGIKSRYTIDKAGVLDVDRMRPRVKPRANDELALTAEAGVAAARDALARAGRDPRDVDAVICSGTSMQRTYPCMAIEMQDALGIEGFGFDMTVACSSGTFGMINAINMIDTGMAKSVLVIVPEITTPQLNFRDRDSHFIFGDVAVAVLIEHEDAAGGQGWRVVGRNMMTKFSNNIRSNFGFLNASEDPEPDFDDRYFVQEGRKVFKEVVPMVAEMIVTEAERLGIDPQALRRLWLHQANAGMNRLIAQRVLGHEASADESPTVLDTYANTSSAGSIIAFHKHHEDLSAGDTGLICSFGAGYSAGAVFVRKVG